MMKRLRVGDVVEIKTSKGLSYAQYTHKHEQYGALLRVFEGFYQKRPDGFDYIVNGYVKFMCFFPLRLAVRKGIVSIVDNIGVPSSEQAFPLFRTGVVDPSIGKVRNWWLWDGRKEWMIGELSVEQRKLPIRGVWNDTLLVERIESGWAAETDQR